MTEAVSNCSFLLLKAHGGNTEEILKATVSLVNAIEINVNTAFVAVLLELDGIFILEEEQKAFLGGHVFTYSRLALPRV